MIAMKFGGTSVENAVALRNVCEIVLHRKARKPLVIASACAGVTNALLAMTKAAGSGNEAAALENIASLRKRHLSIADELLTKKKAEAHSVLNNHFNELEKFIKSVSVLKHLTPRILDHCAAYGEQWSSTLLAYALEERGAVARYLDVRTVMLTDDAFMQATPQFEHIDLRAKETVLPVLERGEIVVTQGFIGATIDGITTTLGRGGSDYSGAILGAALDAEEIQIWTDVDGVLTADPSIITDAKRIKKMTFDEAAELAYFGAKVLHPSTMLPAVKKNIPVRVLNSKRPQIEGTLIVNKPAVSEGCIVKSIAYKEHITVVTVKSTRMLMNYGFLAHVFEVFSHFKKSIDVVATSEVGVSVTIDNQSQLEEIVAELQTFADVTVEPGRSVMCVVGEGMSNTKGVAARIFKSLSDTGVNIELISHGGSEINLTFVIKDDDIDTAVIALHKEFFSDVNGLEELFG